MRILVTGKNGQLGRSIKRIVSDTKTSNTFVFVGREELDLSQNQNILKYFDNNHFDIIINCAAYTKVDEAESQIELASQINHLAVEKLALIAQTNNTVLIHISTDYVFDGNKSESYVETDTTNPVNTYGQTKLKGELSIQQIMPTNAIIIRTGWVYSEYGNNFLDTMLQLGAKQESLNIVSDQIGSPTYANDLANAILKIVQNQKLKTMDSTTQIYHYSNTGSCGWDDFAREIFKLSKIQCSVNPVTTKQYASSVQRPLNTVMNKDKITKKFDMNIPNWKDSLNTCIESLHRRD